MVKGLDLPIRITIQQRSSLLSSLELHGGSGALPGLGAQGLRGIPHSNLDESEGTSDEGTFFSRAKAAVGVDGEDGGWGRAGRATALRGAAQISCEIKNVVV